MNLICIITAQGNGMAFTFRKSTEKLPDNYRLHGAKFIIDDNVYLAKKLGTDGVHLGKNDMPVAEARRILGNRYIIGSTVNSFEDILSVLQHANPVEMMRDTANLIYSIKKNP